MNSFFINVKKYIIYYYCNNEKLLVNFFYYQGVLWLRVNPYPYNNLLILLDTYVKKNSVISYKIQLLPMLSSMHKKAESKINYGKNTIFFTKLLLIMRLIVENTERIFGCLHKHVHLRLFQVKTSSRFQFICSVFFFFFTTKKSSLHCE